MLNPVFGGKNTYGKAIGIIMTERYFPRIPGDTGNATTFDFPVRYHVVKGHDVSARLRVFAGDEAFVELFVKAAQELEKAGVRAITSNCGFLILYQQVLAEAVSIPVFASSLLQVPLIYRMLGKGQKIGIITADATTHGLGKKHLAAAGAVEIPVVVVGMQDSDAFSTVVKDKHILSPEKMKNDMVRLAQDLVEKNPEIGAILIESAEFPPYSKAVQEAVNLPVFDFFTLINMVYSAVLRREFSGFM